MYKKALLHFKKSDPKLHAAGLSVQEAYIQTYATFGAYDWFKVKSNKAPALLAGILKKSMISAAAPVEPVKFAVIEIAAQDEASIVLSFRGKDQRG